MSPFDQAPEFIELDNRRFRTFSPVSREQMHNKHAVLFPASLVAGKSVLDLGCCLGATGHWCLSMGARHYTGIEVQKTYAETARSLLQKYHAGQARIETMPIEEWLREDMASYDIVSILGVLYVFTDYYSILRRIGELAKETVIVESLYPDRAKFADDFSGVMFRESQRINLSDENASLLGRGALLSPRGLQFIMADFGFESKEGVLYPERISESKDVFNAPDSPMNQRYLMRFTKTKRAAGSLSDDLRENRLKNKILW